MLFPTATFALFFLAVLPVSWMLMPRQRAWRPFIVFASYVFYGWWDWRFCFLLAGSTVVNVLVAQRIVAAREQRLGRRWMILGVAVNLTALGFFKYYGFFVDSLITMLRPIGLAPNALLAEILLPVGISFFTFCGISYLVDL